MRHSDLDEYPIDLTTVAIRCEFRKKTWIQNSNVYKRSSLVQFLEFQSLIYKKFVRIKEKLNKIEKVTLIVRDRHDEYR